MRTPLAAYLAATAIAFLLLALFLRNASLLIVALFPTALLGLAAADPPPKPKLSVVRELGRERAAVGQEVQVRVTVRNEGPSLALSEVSDALAPEFELTGGMNRLVLALPRGAAVTLAYTVSAPMKGTFTIGPLHVRSLDALGLAFESFPAGDAAMIAVAPPLEDLRALRIAPRRTRPWFGQVPSRSPGLGSEFFGIREYVAGDETRRMNWKASARFERLYTNEYEGERTSDAVIVLDARSGADVGPAAASTTECGVRAALGIAAALLGAGNRVGLIVQRAMLDWVYPGYGKKQLHRILDALIRVRPGGAWGLEHVAWILARFFPRNVQVIIVSPLVDPRAVGAVASLVARGLDVAVVSPSPLDIEWRMYGRGEAFRDAYRVLKLERSNAIAALRRYAFVADWDPEVQLATVLRGVERFPVRR